MNNPWEKIAQPSSEFNVRLVDKDHPLDLYWGVDAASKYVFLIDAPADSLPDKKALPALTGLSAAIGAKEGRDRLALLLNDKADWELFHALCSDLITATKSIKKEESGGAIILRRLQRWQDFLKMERSKILSPERLKGLLGELLFLNKVNEQLDWEAAIGSWQGPEGAPQDFAINDTAVEVKCQSGGSKPTIRISSIEQLDPQLPKGYLAVYTLANTEKGDEGAFTINTVVADIRKEISTKAASTRERFEDLLIQAGYLYNEKYEDFVFQEIEFQAYSLIDEFPRLHTAEIHSGITSVSYELRLDSCSEFEAVLKL